MKSAVCAAVAGLAVLTGGIAAPAARGQQRADALVEGFQNPPDSARPRTWWHWTRGNVTRGGITRDLEWMKRVGIAGFQLADVNAGGGQEVEAPLEFGSRQWLDAVRHAAAEAKRLGLEMAIFSSPGWSLTGGPWVEPYQAMKKLVWSETVVDGPQSVSLALPQPPSNNGVFQDMGAGRPSPDSTFYADCAVIAYRTPAVERRMSEAKPTATTSGGQIDGQPLYDDSYANDIAIEAGDDGGPAWLQYEFAEPFAARAVTICGGGGIPVGRVLASDNGAEFRTLVMLPGAQLYRQGRVRTFAFPITSARFYRIEFTGAPLGPGPTMTQAPPQPARRYALAEAAFHGGARVHRWEEKAGFSFLFEYDTVPTPPWNADEAIERNDVIDLTAAMAEDGTLAWQAPAGRWTILRLGYSLTGAKNRPATPSGAGYEVDKLSREHTIAYYTAYGGMLDEALGPLYGDALKYFLLDSWEAGYQNWTDDMLEEFRKRRGYDATPYLPVLLGRVVESADASDRFLWDFRRTLADMFAENHYAVMDQVLNGDGLGTYSEAAGVSLEIPEDTLLNKSKVDIPMGEFWVRDLHPRLMYFQDVRGAASAAHVYGKPIVAAEAFTGGGYESPFALKEVADYWLAQGINRLVFHTSAHQPLDTKPGNTMVGTHVHRNITWAEQAGPFMTYLARTCYMLQQGSFVADIAYLLDEGAPSTMPIWGAGTTPAPPTGYDYDFINADALLHRLEVDDEHRLVLPDGMHYQVLVLPQSTRMRPELVRKIRDLVVGGATIVGPKPVASPSLADGAAESDHHIQQLATEVWGDLDGASRTIRYVGKGRVVWGRPLDEVLAMLRRPPDFEYAGGLDAQVAWLHRQTEEADIYYVANLTDQARRLETRFRVADMEAELWRPDAGTIEPASYEITGDRTIVPLELEAHEVVFVVFRKPASAPVRTVSPTATTELTSIDGPWEVTFPPNLGAPERISLAELESWTENADPGVRYFSGTAAYATSFAAPEAWFRDDAPLLLDLGDVRDVAEVRLNGEPVGVVWKPPYRVDVTRSLQRGENRLVVEVTNQWTNRLLGDALASDDERVLSAGGGRFGFGLGPRRPAGSGLLGPVLITSRVGR
jgi:hypothetical protein